MKKAPEGASSQYVVGQYGTYVARWDPRVSMRGGPITLLILSSGERIVRAVSARTGYSPLLKTGAVSRTRWK